MIGVNKYIIFGGVAIIIALLSILFIGQGKLSKLQKENLIHEGKFQQMGVQFNEEQKKSKTIKQSLDSVLTKINTQEDIKPIIIEKWHTAQGSVKQLGTDASIDFFSKRLKDE